jgi:uncharacterized protein involved in response to NO
MFCGLLSNLLAILRHKFPALFSMAFNASFLGGASFSYVATLTWLAGEISFQSNRSRLSASHEWSVAMS